MSPYDDTSMLSVIDEMYVRVAGEGFKKTFKEKEKVVYLINTWILRAPKTKSAYF